MFTGLIQAIGTVDQVSLRDGVLSLVIETPFPGLAAGESVAVDGVCLTAIESSPSKLKVELSPETLQRTTFSDIQRGRGVHLERALLSSERLGGHFVTGHVDGLAKLESSRGGQTQVWHLSVPPELHHQIAPKGSVALAGVSLTVNEVTEHGFNITLIPYTLAHTHFSRASEGQLFNLETDVLAKYVQRQLQAFAP